MKLKQLRSIASNIPGAVNKEKLPKDKLIEAIVKASQNPSEVEISPNERLASYEVAIENGYKIAQEYNEHYGLIDHLDRELSTKLNHRKHKCQSGGVMMSILFFCLQNAFRYYRETCAQGGAHPEHDKYRKWLVALIEGASKVE